MSKRGKHSFDVWDALALVVSMALGVIGLTAISAGFVMLAERIFP